MKSHIVRGRWAVAVLITALALCITPAAPAQAGSETPINGPVFLILSLEQDFDTPADLTDKKAKGSATVVVEIGDFIAGQDIFNTRFEAKKSVKVKLPNKIKSFAKLNGYAFTILGAFDAPDASVHLVSPYDEYDPAATPIPAGVEEAFFLASPFLTDEFVNEFPTTVEIAQFIFDTATAEDPELLNRHTDLTAQQILDYLFLTDAGTDLAAPSEDVFAEAEGDLFPHQPQDGDRLFGFNFKIDPDDGAATTDMEIDVEIDIKPGNTANVIENSDNGVVWAAILTTDAFDAAGEVDWDTVYLGGSLAKDYKIEDANHDGYDDITLKFDVKDIGLTATTTSVTLTGLTNADTPMGFTGSDTVTVK